MGVGACTTTDTTITPATTIGPGTTSISVDPPSFLFGLVCSTAPGAMQSYVATVTDVDRPCFADSDCPPLPPSGVPSCVGVNLEPSTPIPGRCAGTFTLPSSPPTSCTQSVYFEYINVGDSFTAVVDGYEQPASELVPACGLAGPSSLCHTDADCPAAYGCAGQCLIATYASEDTSCLDTCVLADSGVADVESFEQCLVASDFCASTTVGDYLKCVVACGADSTCLTDAPNQYCLDNNLSLLNAPCSEATPAEDGGVPAGGIAGGEVQACTCIYRAVEGNRQMYVQGTPYDTVATPRWTTQPSQPCGAGVNPPTSTLYVNVPIAPCSPLVDSEADAGVTAIQVIPYAALGSTGCTVGDFDGGSTVVTSFEVIPTNSSLAPEAVPTCSATASVTYDQGIVAGQTYTFTLQAYAGAALFLQSSCFVPSTYAGVTATAQCDPLVPLLPDAGITDAGSD